MLLQAVCQFTELIVLPLLAIRTLHDSRST